MKLLQQGTRTVDVFGIWKRHLQHLIFFCFLLLPCPAIPGFCLYLFLGPAPVPAALAKMLQLSLKTLSLYAEHLCMSRPHYHVARGHLHMQIRLMRAEL